MCHAQRTSSPVWTAPSPLHHVQLLSAVALVGLGAREEFVCEDSGPGPRPLRVRPRRLRRYAQPHSPGHRRTRHRDSIHRLAGPEAACVAPLATQAATATLLPATKTPVP